MEVTQPQVGGGGVRTRARARAMAEETAADNSRGHVKRRKLSNRKLLKSPPSAFLQTKIFDCEIHILNECFDAAARHPRSSGARAASSCSSNGRIEKPKVSDLEQESVETGTNARCGYLDESTPTTTEIESSASKQPMVTNRVIPEGKKPLEYELEEFFAAAQKGVNERFLNKYNYDIVNDTPLKGRFEWINSSN